MLNMKEWKEKLLIPLGEFLEHYFPLPDRNVKTLQESTARLIALHGVLESHINRSLDVPDGAYVKITDSLWLPCSDLLFLNWDLQKIQPK